MLQNKAHCSTSASPNRPKCFLDIVYSTLLFHTQVSGKLIISRHQAQQDVKFYSVLSAGNRQSHFTNVHRIYVFVVFRFYSDVQISRQISNFLSRYNNWRGETYHSKRAEAEGQCES
jgi:hypothetical protein